MPLPSPPAAHFTRLPQKRVLTLNMDVPEPWLVRIFRDPLGIKGVSSHPLGFQG